MVRRRPQQFRRPRDRAAGDRPCLLCSTLRRRNMNQHSRMSLL